MHVGTNRLREKLRGVGDLERILARVALRSARPRDLSTLRDGLAAAPEIAATVLDRDGLLERSPLLAELAQRIGDHADTAALLTAAIVAQPPVLQRDGGVIADGYDAELDELRRLSTHADQFLVELEEREKAASGISTLKVGYNRVHGYYIEISKAQADKAPTHYTRRQTTKNAERYITEELKAFEDKVLSARERSLMRERALYEALLDSLTERLEPLKIAAAAMAELDVLAVLAERAEALDWNAPELTDVPGIADRARPPSGGRKGARRTVRAQRPEARRRPPHAGHHRPEHGRQVHLHAPERADRAAGAYRQLRAGEQRGDRPDRSHLHPHRRRRRPLARAIHLHGGDERDGQHPAQRHRRTAWC